MGEDSPEIVAERLFFTVFTISIETRTKQVITKTVPIRIPTIMLIFEVSSVSTVGVVFSSENIFRINKHIQIQHF